MEMVATTVDKSCKAPVKSSPPTNQHLVFFIGRMLFLSPKQQCQSIEGEISHSLDLLTSSSPGVFQLCLWPLIAPGYLGGGLPCLSSALWCQYPNVCPFVSRINQKAVDILVEFFWGVGQTIPFWCWCGSRSGYGNFFKRNFTTVG